MENVIKDCDGNYIFNNPVTTDDIVKLANKIIGQKFKRGAKITNPNDSIDLFKWKLMKHDREVFGVLFLDQRHCVIEYVELFQGTINAANIYPREVVKKALEVNAVAVIFGHNHPSGNPEPSEADKTITDKLKECLATVDIRTLDHIVVGNNDIISFAEKGLI